MQQVCQCLSLFGFPFGAQLVSILSLFENNWTKCSSTRLHVLSNIDLILCVCVCLLCRALSLILFLFTFLEFCLFNFLRSVKFSLSDPLYLALSISASVLRMFVLLHGASLASLRGSFREEGTTRQIQTNTTATPDVYTTLQIPYQTKHKQSLKRKYFTNESTCLWSSTLIYQINIPVWLPDF